jgi:signal peptidase II
LSKGFRLFIGLFAIMLVADQLVKVWVRSAMVPYQSLRAPWPGVFELDLTFNKGIAFGMLQGLGVYLTPVAIVIACLAGLYSYRNPKESRWLHAALGLIAAGALGNLYDRAFLGKVTDMFSLVCIHFPVFNVADSCITVGAAILFVHGLVQAIMEHRTEEAPEDAPDDAAVG